MRAKPDMEPWVFTDKNKMSSFRSGTNSTSVGALVLGLCRPYGAQKNVYQCLTQGLRLGLCRSIALGDYCIIRHSLRYYRHSGLVIYKSKLPAPSVSMPCDYRILQSPPKGQVLLVLLETVGRSHLNTLKQTDNRFVKF